MRKSKNPVWIVAVRRCAVTDVVIMGGDEAKAREEAAKSVRERDDDVIEVLKIERFD